MAVTFNHSSLGTQTAGTSMSWSHNATGDNILVIGVAWIAAGAESVTGVTYNGVAMTAARALSSGGTNRVQLWYLVNPASGSNTVTVSFSSAVDAVGVGSSYSGVNTSSPIGTAVEASGTSTNATVTATGIVGGLAVDMVCVASTISLTCGQTEILQQTWSALTGGSSRKDATPTVIMSWTLSGSSDWVIQSVPITPLLDTKKLLTMRIG